MKILRTPIAFFQASLAFLGFCIIAVVFYSQVPSPFNYIAALASLLLGIYFGRMVFNMGRSQGVLATMTGSRASYELDELEPIPGSGVLKLTPNELTSNFADSVLPFNEGTLAIWGDTNNSLLSKRHQLKGITFDVENKILNLAFSDACFLEVKNPSLIMCADTYLKISRAKKVTWRIPNTDDGMDAFVYYNTGKTIQSTSNTNWNPSTYDFGIGMNAVYLQG
ncbi:hypothetical protein [Aequorivita marina]|uniref:hypothetical protein n=1 Tax=Aequorivita marina TaxID=3073654 RepID=UPI002874557F|nr:hypothetical protein [Aequorivita sp. S2608]MDS1298452.1 hypothetical protein [Aequorivita sp. S2608]